MPSNVEYALMAGRAYQSTRDVINYFPAPEGWDEPLDKRKLLPSGFEAGYFKRGNEIVISFAGTGPEILNPDWLANLGLTLGVGATQLNEAAAYYMEVRAVNPNATITFTGHSLGGGLAALLGVFFNETAVTFDPGPFRASANNDVRNGLVSYLTGLGYSEADKTIKALQSFRSSLPANNAGASDEPGVRGEAKVDIARVAGEAIDDSILLAPWNPIGVEGPPLTHGDIGVSSFDLHSQALLTTFVQNDSFRQVTFNLTDLLPMIFDENLFEYTTAKTNTTDTNLLEHLIRHQVGGVDGVAKKGDQMLSRFTSDLQKLAADAGLSVAGADLTQALIAFAMQAYYEGRIATDTSKQLYETISGGVRFDRSDISNDPDLNKIKGYVQYFRNYLATLPAAEQAIIEQQLPNLLDWYLTGSRMTASAGDKTAFMLGANGADNLTGGTQGDLLIGRGGNDTLSGGAGLDTYAFSSGDGRDTINDSGGDGAIKIGGAEIKGTDTASYLVSDAGKHRQWKDGAGYLYTEIDGDIGSTAGGKLRISGGTLGANDSITLEGFNNSELGITLDTKPLIQVAEGIGPNVFLGAAHEVVQNVANAAEGLGKTVTVYLSRAADAGETLLLDVKNTVRNAWSAVFGDEQRSFDSGPLEVTLEEGQTQVTFALVNTDDIDDSGIWQLEAKLNDSTGTQSASNSLDVNFTATVEADEPATATTINGDVVPEDINPGKAGLQAAGDAYGNPLGEAGAYGDILGASAANDHILAGEDNDDVGSGAGDDWVEGGNGNDYLNGEDGQDRIEGGGGNDIMYGDAGDDRLYAEAFVETADAIANGNGAGSGSKGDWLSGAAGADLLVGGADNDVLAGGAGADLLVAGAGDDELLGDANYLAQFLPEGDPRYSIGSTDWYHSSAATYDWTVYEAGNGQRTFTPVWGETRPAGGGADTLYAGGGNDHAWGGEGDDLIYGEDGDDELVGDDGNDVVLGGAGTDKLIGDSSSLDASLHGDDFLDGGEGDDELDGQGGSDALFGGAGDDTLVGDSVDTAAERMGDDYLDGEDGADTLIGAGGNDTLYGGTGNDTLAGDDNETPEDKLGDDYLDGEAGNDILLGGGGSDTLVGGDGADQLYGDSTDTPEDKLGDDYLDGGAGDDTLAGAGGNDILIGGEGDDRLAGDSVDTAAEMQGDDLLDGGDGDDTLWGGGGSDELVGGVGNDQLYGDDGSVAGDYHGSDTLTGGDGDDTLIGAGGADTLSGGAGNDILVGDAGDVAGQYHGNDVLDGGDGDDELWGGGGNDTLIGGGGDDQLVSGLGADMLSGGDGNDTYVVDIFTAGTKHIEDVGGDGDTLVIQGLTFGQATLRLGSLLIDNGMGGEIHIDDFDPADPYGSRSIEFFQFDDGTYTYDELLAKGFEIVGTPDADELSGTALVDSIDGLESDDVISGGAGNDTLNGGGGNDVLLGGDGADVLEGGTGDDLLAGEAGNDLLQGGDGNDVLLGGDGIDTLDGGAGDDLMAGGQGNDSYLVDSVGDSEQEGEGEGIDTVYAAADTVLGDNVEVLVMQPGGAFSGTGNAIDNLIYGNESDNLLSGLGGNDRIDGWLGDDTLLGGEGNDTLNGEGGDDVLLGGGGDDTLHGGEGSDVLAGGAGNDTFVIDDMADTQVEAADEGFDTVIAHVDATLGDNVERLILSEVGDAYEGTGNGQDNVIVGNSRDNWLNGGAGNDILIGGEGDDGYVVDAAGDVVIEAEDEGWDVVTSAVDMVLADNIEGLELMGDALAGTGNALDNGLVGNAGDNLLAGGAGADWMAGWLGDDTYWVDDWNDTIEEYAGEGNDTAIASVSYVLSDNVETLRLVDGAVEGYGNGGNNLIVGNEQDNWLDGYGGADVLEGGSGADTYFVDEGGDAVVENTDEGMDTVFSSVDLTLADNVENLTLLDGASVGVGNALDNRIIGNNSYNLLQGLEGNDTLVVGYYGSGVLAGGSGDDTYVLSRYSWSADVLEEAGEGDDTVVSYRDYWLGAYVENLRLENDPDNYYLDWINGYGNELDNSITGSDGINELAGYEGADAIDGGGSSDNIYGGDGGDRLYGGADVLITGYEVDGVLTDNADDIYGGDGYDWIDGGSGDDRLAGGIGNDVLFGGLDGLVGRDVMSDGGEGGQSGHVWTEGGVFLTNDDFLDGEDGDDSLDGGSGNDQLYGGAGADVLYGGDDGTLNFENDDWLDGGEGIDAMRGGTGNDSYVVDGVMEALPPVPPTDCDIGTGDDAPAPAYAVIAADSVIESADEGYDTVFSTVSYVLPDHVESLTLWGWENTDATGNNLDNVLAGNEGDNILDGGAGADYLAGGWGNDTYVVDDWGDFAMEWDDTGVDTVRTGLSSYWLGGNLENLDLMGNAEEGYGNELDNRIRGNAAGNYIDGGDGDDLIAGAGGNDVLYGRAGDDTYIFGRGDGQDDIIDWQGENTLVLREIATEEVTLALEGSDLVVGVRGSDDRVRIYNGAVEPESFSALQFCGGPVFDRDAVLAAARNQAPVAQLDMAEVQEDELVEVAGNVTANDWDADDDPIIVTSTGTYQGSYGTLTLEADGSYFYSLDNGNSLIQTLAEGAETWDSFSYALSDDRVFNRQETSGFLDIRIAGTNDIPVLVTPLADQGVNAGAAWVWQVPEGAFADIDQGDELSYTATLADGSALPSWLSFDAATRSFSGMAPGSTASGTGRRGRCGSGGGTATTTLDITVIASDGHGVDSVASDTFRLTISGGTSGGGGGHDHDHHHHHHHGGHHHDGHGDSHHGDHDGGHGSHCGHGGKDHGRGGKDRDCFDFDRMRDLCDDFDRRHGKSGCGDRREDYRGATQEDYAERWTRMDRKLSAHLARDSGQSQWMDERCGADLGALGKHFSAGGPGLQTFGRDSFSLVCGGTKLSGFKGLQEGVARLG